MKSFHLSGQKFDIAVEILEMFCVVKFSNFLLGQKFVAVEFEFSIRSEIWRVEFKFEFCKGRPPLAMPNGTNIPVSHIILYELSDCILYRQTNGTFWINYSMFFFGKLALKKALFWGSHNKICWPPHSSQLLWNFFPFLWLPLINN